MKRITTIGAALIDIYFSSEKFDVQELKQQAFLCQPYGQKVEMMEHEIITGGAGSNTAIAFAKRGHKVSTIVELGDDSFGKMILDELKAEKVDISKVIVEKKEKTGVSVILRGRDGRRTVMVSRSAAGMLDDYDIPVDFLAKQDWIHLSSIGGNLNALSEIWQVFDRSEVGLSWNPGTTEIEQLVTGALTLPQSVTGIFIVNDDEWALLETMHTQILANFQIVIVTAGKKGGRVYVDGAKYRDYKGTGKPAFEETGAGDAFVSAFVSTFLYDCTVDEAITAGLHNSESVIAHVGAKKGLLAY